MLNSCMLHDYAGERRICMTCLLKHQDASKGYANLLPWPDVPSEVAVTKTEGGRRKSLPSLPFNPSLAKIPWTQDQVSAYSPVYVIPWTLETLSL